MEIVFLIAGLVLITVGALIVLDEAQSRLGTAPVQALVVGFSTGKSRRSSFSFHPVAEYVAPDGLTYYIEGSVGSSAPLHEVGDFVTVLVRPMEPDKAVLRSRLSYVMGVTLSSMGLASAAMFWFTFEANFFSLIVAVFVVGGLVLRIRKAWRRNPMSLEQWRAYKRERISPRVFRSRSEIAWADPVSLSVAVENYEKSRRYSVPILYALAFAALFAMLYVYRRTENFLEHSNRTTGLVVDLKERDSAGDGPSTYSPVIEFTDDHGKVQRFADSLSSSRPLYRRGQMVTILYKADDSAEAQIDRGLWNYWLSGVLGAAGSLFAMLGTFSGRKRRRIA
jgi:hypothetical protein